MVVTSLSIIPSQWTFVSTIRSRISAAVIHLPERLSTPRRHISMPVFRNVDSLDTHKWRDRQVATGRATPNTRLTCAFTTTQQNRIHISTNLKLSDSLGRNLRVETEIPSWAIPGKLPQTRATCPSHLVSSGVPTTFASWLLTWHPHP